MPKAQEIAEIRVDGRVYHDWLSVEVKLVLYDACDYFRFTCSEGKPLLKNWSDFRIRPGDKVDIRLAGQNVITNGMVYVRQVAYTGTHHGIEISGKSKNGASQVAGANTKTGEFTKASPTQIFNKLYSPIGCVFNPVGPINDSPLARYCIPPGATIWDAVEPISRMRAIVMGTDLAGNPTGGLRGGNGGDPLIEGINILEGREVLSILDGTNPSVGIGQHGADNDTWGAKVAHAPFAKAENSLQSMFGTGGSYSARKTMMELPGLIADAGIRSGFENEKQTTEMANVTVTVQGWVMSGGALWPRPGCNLFVDSPMLIINESLELKKTIFTQDVKAGTRTTLEMARKVAAGKQSDVSGGESGGG